MSKIIVKKYLPPVGPKLVPKLKMFRIYWNLGNSIFRISRSRFWCQILISLNIYHLFVLNWSQNQKCSEFIEIEHIQYFKYANLEFDVKMVFMKYYHLLGSNWSQNEKYSGFIEISVHLIFLIALSWFCCQKLFSLNTYQLFGPKWS